MHPVAIAEARSLWVAHRVPPLADTKNNATNGRGDLFDDSTLNEEQPKKNQRGVDNFEGRQTAI